MATADGPATQRVAIRTYYLEITDLADLRPSTRRIPDLRIARAADPSPELSRFFYTAVGGDWFWTRRLDWTWDRWMELIDRPELETWVASIGGNPAGYAELERQDGGDLEILQFGMLDRYVGRGIGGVLLTHVIRHAFETGAQRVWLHTCIHDHPKAVKHYEARGMRLYREEVFEKEMPVEPPGPWPGSGRPSPWTTPPGGEPQ